MSLPARPTDRCVSQTNRCCCARIRSGFHLNPRSLFHICWEQIQGRTEKTFNHDTKCLFFSRKRNEVCPPVLRVAALERTVVVVPSSPEQQHICLGKDGQLERRRRRTPRIYRVLLGRFCSPSRTVPPDGLENRSQNAYIYMYIYACGPQKRKTRFEETRERERGERSQHM